MKRVTKSVLLWYSPREMYDLVVAVHDYPRFLPWCNSAEVLQQQDDAVIARLGLHYMGVRHTFTTRNHNVEGERVGIQLVDGPFSQLEGTWVFRSLQRPGSDAPACKIEFDLRSAFSSRPLASVVSPVFDRGANTFVESVVKRAEDVYGAR